MAVAKLAGYSFFLSKKPQRQNPETYRFGSIRETKSNSKGLNSKGTHGPHLDAHPRLVVILVRAMSVTPGDHPYTRVRPTDFHVRFSLCLVCSTDNVNVGPANRISFLRKCVLSIPTNEDCSVHKKRPRLNQQSLDLMVA